jgi:hypothetical protein
MSFNNGWKKMGVWGLRRAFSGMKLPFGGGFEDGQSK